MAKGRRPFPLVADNEPVMTPAPVMHLYDKEDLISNISGVYQEKTYADKVPAYQPISQMTGSDELTVSAKPAPAPVTTKSYAQEMREAAKQDLKQKRQTFLAQEMKIPAKPSFQREPTKPVPSDKRDKPKVISPLARLANHLRQEEYILAELPRLYQEPNNLSIKEKPKKNNYDFLKRSQIYNQTEHQLQKERQVAQELNLTRFEDMK
ncbi:hypothetical protein [Streptococcus cuniculipharyngis]|uniref:Cystathionine gamma-synthase n=1 Tax=Streptococcus cuniculipharyngis TaxID=1562651 RepID=A0A5C5SEC1_9STRE|nr:hypothetical protein [Streptococcus cuniculipharyngis]TWS98151.1 hypothetical protein FRX57_04275 [Streptococcus cuniculipharyngis]